MGMKIVGKKKVDYVNRDGRKVEGVSLNIIHDSGDVNNVDGQFVETVFCSAKWTNYASILSIPLGSYVDITYNRYGNPENIIVRK